MPNIHVQGEDANRRGIRGVNCKNRGGRGKLSKIHICNLIYENFRIIFNVIEKLLEAARAEDIALLVVGDPFGATTHADLVLRAREMAVPLKVVRDFQFF